MSQLTIPELNLQGPAAADEINDAFTLIEAVANGNIDNDNFSPMARIAVGKLANANSYMPRVFRLYNGVGNGTWKIKVPPFPCTIVRAYAYCRTCGGGGTLDIHKNGVTILAAPYTLVDDTTFGGTPAVTAVAANDTLSAVYTDYVSGTYDVVVNLILKTGLLA